MNIQHGTSSGFEFTHTKSTILTFYHHNGMALSPCNSCSSHCWCSYHCCSYCCCCFCCCHHFCFCSCLRCSSLFAILRCKIYRFIFNQSHPFPFFIGLSTTRISLNAGGTSSGSDSICSQGYVMDRVFAIQRSFLSQNRCFQWIIGNQVWPVWIYYFHVV